jgi:hypothetical protein
MKFVFVAFFFISLSNTLYHANIIEETSTDFSHRNLKKTYAKGKRSKDAKLRNMVRISETNQFPISMALKPWSIFHNFSSNAIFTVALSKTLMKYDAVRFTATARKAGFTGDIVVAVYPTMLEGFLKQLKADGAIVYEVPVTCGSNSTLDVACTFDGQDGKSKASINMIRYYLYHTWSLLYSEESLILLSDFNDVFFQSDPFKYKLDQWFSEPKKHQLVVYLEAHPNMAIYKNPYNSGWISGCYGDVALKSVESNTVSCSGNTMGTRNAIAVYVYIFLYYFNYFICIV